MEPFFVKRPALLSGLSLLLATFVCFSKSATPLIPLAALIPFLSRKQQVTILAWFFLGFVSPLFFFSLPEIPDGGLKTELLFSPDEKVDATKWKTSPTIRYRGVASSKEKGFRGLPITFYLPKRKGELSCLHTYKIRGVLYPRRGGRFGFSPEKNTPPTQEGDHFSLGDFRMYLKEKVKTHISSYPISYEAKNFIGGMLTGQFKKNPATEEISRVGLSHLLAISGFHFSLVSLCTYLMFRLCASLRTARMGSLIFVFLYFLFLGPSASITRAFVMIALALISSFFERNSDALNNLGIALCLVVALNPLVVFDLGFQFSFLATGAILIFYPIVLKFILRQYPLPRLKTLQKQTKRSKLLCLLKKFFLESIALNSAVHLVVLPLSLLIFEQFPLLSFPFNLFSPPWVSLGMTFVLMSFFLYPLDALFHFPLFSFGAFVLDRFIRLCGTYPLEIHKVLIYRGLNSIDTVIYFVLLFSIGILLSSKDQETNPPLIL